jgi:dihydrofolate reductase
MRKIVYYVATSLDGFICGENGDISGFVAGGNGVEKYFEDLRHFDTVIMGRKTYEFGYRFGLQPGQPAYPYMRHYIFSNTLQFKSQADQITVLPLSLDNIDVIQNGSGSDIYLCGGGQLAGWLLEHEKIDQLKLKLNPLILGTGIKLFGDCRKKITAELMDSKEYEKGLQIMSYRISYS